MKIDLRNLSGNSGSVLPFSGEADLRGEKFYGAYPFRQPAVYQGEIQNHLGVLHLKGTVTTTYSTCCARCLKPLEIELSAETDTLLTHDPAVAEAEDEVYLLDGNEVEVEEILIPALFLQIEMTYLCDPDCKGLCPYCGIDRNQGTCHCSERKIDPRLAGLEKLLK